MIESTVDTAFVPLLKRVGVGGGPSESHDWRSPSSSYGTLMGLEYESSTIEAVAHDATALLVVGRGEEEKDCGGRISPPTPTPSPPLVKIRQNRLSPPLPPRHRASSSDGWSLGSINKPPRQKSPPTQLTKKKAPSQNNTPLLFPELHVSLKFTTLPTPPLLHEERSTLSGRHRRTNSDIPQLRTKSHRNRNGGGRGSRREGGKNNSFSGSLNVESVMLIPDPRWGRGGGGGTATSPPATHYRTFSSSSQQSMTNMISYSTSTDSGDPLGARIACYWGGCQDGYFGSPPAEDGTTSRKVVETNGNQQPPLRLPRRSLTLPPPPPKRHHHRTSYSEVSHASTHASYDRSVDPVMTDMTKSALYKGITNMGIVKLQLPKDNFRLLIDRDLESGCVYKRALVENEDDYFQEYHITIDNSVAFDHHRRLKPPPLPPMYYVMAVDSDIYQRMFDEVSESVNSPCGLFYFGHHKDVSYPSIAIAVVSLAIVFSLMLWATCYVDG